MRLQIVSVGANSPRRAGRYIPAAPADMVGAMARWTASSFVVPCRKLIVVLTGQAAPDQESMRNSGGFLCGR